MTELPFFIAYLLCGSVIGLLAGLFGIGGGIVGIPALLFLFNLQSIPEDLSMHMAIGTLFATIVVTSIVSIFSHYKSGMIVFPILKHIVSGTVIGSIIGIIVSNHLQSLFLQRVFGLFLFVIAFYLLLNIEPPPKNIPANSSKLLITTLGLGVLSGTLGLGGGLLLVPYLNWCGLPIRNAIATATVCILPAALIGSFIFSISTTGYHAAMPSYHSGLIYWPAFLGITLTSVMFAPFGAHLAQNLPIHYLKRIFAIFLIIVGLLMLLHTH